MTRPEAVAFLKRNPQIKERLLDMCDDNVFDKLDVLFLFDLASYENDAKQDVVAVARAMGWCR